MSSENGQSLAEVIVAATVGILVVAALTFTTIFSLRNANFAKNSAQATKLAQEGMERVRTGRDRNQAINALGSVTSWNGDSSGTGAIWSYQINSNCGTAGPPPTFCYFNTTNQGVLNYLTTASVMPSLAEPIPPTKPIFHRAVILSDDSSFATQKTVTVVVTWSDFAGSHESKLTTILRKL